MRQIEELYHSARERDPAERRAFLLEACGSDEDLRSEVESLLAQGVHGSPLDRHPAWDNAQSLLASIARHLTPGEQLGPYKIEAPIGAGGMGEVYRAYDTRLGRKVAIKVSAEQYTERFEREARTVAALNHPNICTLHDLGPNYMVMELLEGETIAARLEKGALPIGQVLEYGAQISDALAAAHGKGITHRDLKPGNIMLTRSGVKVLDFGLARMEGVPGETLTASDVVMGTPAYMAPEQRDGKEADPRTDIYSLGLVLYEMATGERAYGAATLQTIQPIGLDRVVKTCLAKDPDQRFQSALDIKRVLAWVREPSGESLSDKLSATRPLKLRLGWIAAAIALMALGIVAYFNLRERPPTERVLRYTIASPDNATDIHSFAISPDGRFVVMAVGANGGRQLWLRALGALAMQPIPGTEDATYPFWSPDNRYIAFFAQGKLKKLAIGAAGETGPAQSICDASSGRGGSWSREGLIVFSPNAASPAVIQRVSANGGAPADVTRADGIDKFPVFLPDGKHFLYMHDLGTEEQNGIFLGSLDGKKSRRVLPDISGIAFALGRILFVRDSTLMAQPFDAQNEETTGAPFPLAAGVSLTTNITYAPVSASETGILLYESSATRATNQMAWYDRGGKLLGLVDAPGAVYEPAISPDEKTVAFRRQASSGSDLWLWDSDRSAEQRLTAEGSYNAAPIWSPRGDSLAFVSNQGNQSNNLYQRPASRTGKDELLLSDGNNKPPSQWSRDGQFIVFSELDPKTNWDIVVLPMKGERARKPIPFLHTEFNELQGQLSPDGHWMAYTSDESGRREVLVRTFPPAEGQWKVSIAGGQQARWRGDGEEMFFVGLDGKMMAVAITAKAAANSATKRLFEPGTPQALFDARLAESPANNLFEYDVTADGKRFLLATVGTAPWLNVIVNWDEQLKK